MSGKAIYRWSGEYFGFIRNGRLFNAGSDYLGWIGDDGRAWRSDGTFLGELVNLNYILRRTAGATPAKRAKIAKPAHPAFTARKAKRTARARKAGWVDVLDEFE